MLPKLKMVDISFELSSYSVEPFKGEPGNLALNTPQHIACPGTSALVMRPDQRTSSSLGWWKILVWCQVRLPKFGESKNKIMTGHTPWFLPQLKRDALNITLVHGQQFSGNETRECFQGSVDREINSLCSFFSEMMDMFLVLR